MPLVLNFSPSKRPREVLIGETRVKVLAEKGSASIFKPAGHDVRSGCVEMPRDVLNERKYVAAAAATKSNHPTVLSTLSSTLKFAVRTKLRR